MHMIIYEKWMERIDNHICSYENDEGFIGKLVQVSKKIEANPQGIQ